MYNFKQLFAVLTVFAGMLYLPQLLFSQSLARTDTSVHTFDEVIVSASRYKQAPSSVGRNVTVISQSEIRNSMHTSVAGILAEQQSVYITGQGQTPGSLQNVYLRNSNTNHTVVMIDGVRMSDPSTAGNSIDLSELSLAGIKQIEIVRGSHSTLYGSSAIGGVINIITQKQNKTGIHANLDTQQGSLNGGSYFTQNNLSLNGGLKSGWYSNLAVTQKFTPGLDATIDTTTSGGFNPQDKDGFRKLDFFGNVGYRTSEFDIHGSYRKEGQRSQLDGGAYNDDSNAQTEFDRNLFAFGTGLKLSKSMKLEYDGAYSNLQRDFLDDSSLVAPGGPYDGSYTETNARGTLLENDLKAIFGTDNLRFIVGTSASRQTMSTRNYVYSRSQFGVYENTTDLDSLNLDEIIYNGYIHSDINGGIITNELSAFSLAIGARYTHHDAFGSHITYEINPKVQVGSALFYGSLTSGYNAPSLYQLYSPAKEPGAFNSRGNAGLNPETSVSYELGIKQDITSTIHLEFSLYRTNVKNGISYIYLWDKSKPVANLSAKDYLGDTYINVAEEQINGIEVGLNANIFSNLLFKGNLNFSNSKLFFTPGDIDTKYTGGNHVQIFESGVFVDKNRELDGLTRRPSINANLGLDYQPTPKWSIGIESQFIGNRDDIYYSASLGPYGAQDLSKISGYNLTDLKLQYRLSQNFKLGAKVENVFDTRYSEINGYRTRGRGFFVKASVSI